MNPGENIVPTEAQIGDKLKSLEPTKRQRVLRKIVMAALGSVPWVGGLLTAVQAYKVDEGQAETDSLQRQWLEEHKLKWQKLSTDLSEIAERLDSFGEEVHARLESEEYLMLVRKAFRGWEQADTDQKREYIKRLIANAGGSKVCSDDLVRLFLDWLERYHEAHFKVIREIYKHPGITRHGIWANIHGEFPRDDSSEADLFRLLIGDLSTGRIIRQHRETNYQGQFVTKTRTKGSSSGVMKSAFDDEEPYELTELGKKFVHYVFSDMVKRIEDTTPQG